jgi:membrane associated rhomboid family serine protease
VAPIGPGLLRLVRTWQRSVKPFAKVFYAYILIAAASLGVLLVQYAFPAPACTIGSSSFPATICFLSNSQRTLWGIVTSMFVHYSLWPHYLSNMISLFTFTLVFALTNGLASAKEKQSRQRVFIFGMFLSGASANVGSLWVNAFGCGASGLVYAAWGITSVFCLINALSGVRQSQDVALYQSDSPNPRRSRNNRLVNFIFSVILIGTAFLFPSLFLAAGPGVNVFVHFLSFIFAFMGTTIWYLVYYARNHSLPRESAEGDA